ncbi:MAG: hypothetical protein ACT4PJ_16245 [Gemmatimonadaceae bacterium]
MALREFSDADGRRWRVWDIRPDQLHGATRAEDYLQSMIHGWLAFEPAGGGEKRRLSPIPPGWDSASEAELEKMLERAEPSQTDTPTSPHAPLSLEPGPTIRTFRYPTGRYWTVNEQIETTSPERQRLVLRFTSGSRALETRTWPHEWARLSENELADLLYRSFPRPTSDNPTAHRRRRGDDA